MDATVGVEAKKLSPKNRGVLKSKVGACDFGATAGVALILIHFTRQWSPSASFIPFHMMAGTMERANYYLLPSERDI